MKSKILILLLAVPLCGTSQVLKSVSYAEYIKEVYENNISYAAEKLNVSIATANVQASKVFNDPSLAVEYSNNDDHNKQMGQGYSIELSKSFTLGKRKAAINLAKSEKEVTEALLEDFFRNLRFDASLAYMEAMKQTHLYEVKENSYLSMKELAEADSIKFSLGKITEVDALQSKEEEGIMHNELLQSENDLYNSYVNLNYYLGSFRKDTLYTTKEDFEEKTCLLPIDELLAIAVDKRADLIATIKNKDVAKRALTLAHREKNFEFELAAGYNYNTEVRNEIAPAPQFNGMTAGITIPLKFSNFNKGTINAAKYQVRQSESMILDAELRVKNEVLQSYRSFTSFQKQVQGFNRGLLERADEVLKGKIYSYNRGETSLLEVLDAQRTYNEVKTLYIETLFNLSLSYLELEKSVGCEL